ncbi:MAG: 23S rRNA (uracil(1939)-C(5))-methyltransferase RlmD [Patescibacteria group bacterium]|nr:23S rRNA (uracil(1939)-C(5))-methyltransferase RlmD [Patescibacteria group bacterium]
MKFGHKLKIEIDGYDAKGRGTARAEIAEGIERDIAVPHSAKGDELEVVFIKRDHAVKICELEKIVKAGADRIKPVCEHAGKCGGCIWQHLKYEAQLEEKMRGVRELFGKIGLEDKVLDVMPAEETLNYRNRMDYAVGWNGEIGLKETGSWNRYVDIKECHLLQPGAGEILQIVREWMTKHDLQPWDVKFHSGDVRYVVIRDGVNTNERMVIVVVGDATRISDKAKKDIKDKVLVLSPSPSPSPSSLLIGEQSKPADLSYAQSFEVLIGKPSITEVVNDVTYEIHPNSFFQTNTKMAARLQDVVLEAVRDAKTKKLLDLYCGLGFFGIAAAKKIGEIQEVVGYELDEEAIKLASQNMNVNEVGEKCRFFSGPAEALDWKDVKADTIILDPPRSGLHHKVIQTLLAEDSPSYPQTIIYVSCNYHRLEHELPSFMEKYDVVSIQPLDLFPQTRHIETVVILKLKALG